MRRDAITDESFSARGVARFPRLDNVHVIADRLVGDAHHDQRLGERDQRRVGQRQHLGQRLHRAAQRAFEQIALDRLQSVLLGGVGKCALYRRRRTGLDQEAKNLTVVDRQRGRLDIGLAGQQQRVGELDAVDIQLKPFCDRFGVVTYSRQSGLRCGIVVKDRRLTAAEMRLEAGSGSTSSFVLLLVRRCPRSLSVRP